MATALWPATLGYLLDTLMQPVLDDDTVRATRAFFTGFVSGRGAVPAIRVGSQPYGVLPAVAYSRMRIEGERGAFLPALHERLLAAREDWAVLSSRVAHVGRPGDGHQTLLTILGLHATSVEFAHRHAAGLDELFNRANLWGAGATWLDELRDRGAFAGSLALLRRLGYGGDELPDLAGLAFGGRGRRVHGPLIDERPLSESEPVRASTTDGRNYLQWLTEAARASLETLRREEGFAEAPPRALLYLLLRHALLLGYWDGAVRLAIEAGVLDAAELAGVRREQPFVHVASDEAASESRFARLYEARCPHHRQRPDARSPTTSRTCSRARRQRPSCTSRSRPSSACATCPRRGSSASWPSTSTRAPTASMRGCAGSRTTASRACAVRCRGEAPRTGIHLGAYGWLEDVVPRERTLSEVELAADLAAVFDDPTAGPLMRDSTNGGYVHAPSLNHAVTAAVLRSGYLAHATRQTPDAFAVDLRSRRVRTALEVVEGMRNGQSLGALLGYRLERGLHDRHAVAEVDEFILDLRKAFPLVADRLADTRSEDDVPIDAIEARNVVDGLALASHIRQTGNRSYPFGLTLPAATTAQARRDRRRGARAARRARRGRGPCARRGRASGRARQHRARSRHPRRLRPRFAAAGGDGGADAAHGANADAPRRDPHRAAQRPAPLAAHGGGRDAEVDRRAGAERVACGPPARTRAGRVHGRVGGRGRQRADPDGDAGGPRPAAARPARAAGERGRERDGRARRARRCGVPAASPRRCGPTSSWRSATPIASRGG